VDAIPRGNALWLDLVEREHSYLLAMARLEAERRKARRDAPPDDPRDEDAPPELDEDAA